MKTNKHDTQVNGASSAPSSGGVNPNTGSADPALSADEVKESNSIWTSLVRNEWNMALAAKELGMGYDQMRRRVRKYKIKLQAPKPDYMNKSKLKSAYKKFGSTTDVAKHFGVTNDTILMHKRRLNIDIPNAGQFAGIKGVSEVDNINKGMSMKDKAKLAKLERDIRNTLDVKGSINAAAKALGMHKQTLQSRMKDLGIKDPNKAGLELKNGIHKKNQKYSGDVFLTQSEKLTEDCYIITSAQNNTPVHKAFWNNLQAYAKYKKARLMVTTFSYRVDETRNIKRGSGKKEQYVQDWASELKPYIYDKRAELFPGIVLCGEGNILPTTRLPLVGLDTFPGPVSAIFGHSTIAMSTVPTYQGDDHIFKYTTGTVTLRNYIQRNAGIKASWLHTYGALIVTGDRKKGIWFVRQLNAVDSNGEFYDLDVKVSQGKVTRNNNILALIPGDIHYDEIDKDVEQALFGKTKSILEELKPKTLVLHDTIDNNAINFFTTNNAFENYERHQLGKNSLMKELKRVTKFLNDLKKRTERIIVVESNHDRRINRWLMSSDWRSDPENAEIYLELNLQYVRAINEGLKDKFLPIQAALKYIGVDKRIKFMLPDQSYKIMGIECGEHGDIGTSGTKGTHMSLSRLGRKMITGHTHQAKITHGLFTVGTSTELNLSYTRGASAWSHHACLIYPNGKRTLVHMQGDQWKESKENTDEKVNKD